MQTQENVFYDGNKVRFNFTFTTFEGIDNLRDFVKKYSNIFVRIEREKRVFILTRKSKHCMSALSVSEEIVSETVLKKLKSSNCFLPRMFEVKLDGNDLVLRALQKGFDD